MKLVSITVQQAAILAPKGEQRTLGGLRNIRTVLDRDGPLPFTLSSVREAMSRE